MLPNPDTVRRYVLLSIAYVAFYIFEIVTLLAGIIYALFASLLLFCCAYPESLVRASITSWRDRDTEALKTAAKIYALEDTVTYDLLDLIPYCFQVVHARIEKKLIQWERRI